MKKKPCELRSLILIGAFTVLISPFALAADSLHHAIHQQTEAFLQQLYAQQTLVPESSDLVLAINKIDSRITVPPCNRPYSYYVEPNALAKRFFSVRVSCDELNWFTYTSVRATFTTDMVVTNGTISPNTVLTSANLRVDKVDINKVRHTGFTSIADVVGARMKYRVRDGQPVQRRMLCYVCEGDRITIAARVGSMEVKTSGIAQQDGTIGDTIEVKNSRSSKTVFGQIKNTQEVVVNL